MAKKRGRTFPIKISDAEIDALRDAAEMQGTTLAAWFREAALAHTERVCGITVPEEKKTVAGNVNARRKPAQRLAA